jgi:hypothetical protein
MTFEIEWKGLTQAEYESIVGAYNDLNTVTNIVFKTPLGESYYVTPSVRSPEMEERFYKIGGAIAVDCRLSLQSTEEILAVGP